MPFGEDHDCFSKINNFMLCRILSSSDQTQERRYPLLMLMTYTMKSPTYKTATNHRIPMANGNEQNSWVVQQRPEATKRTERLGGLRVFKESVQSCSFARSRKSFGPLGYRFGVFKYLQLVPHPKALTIDYSRGVIFKKVPNRPNSFDPWPFVCLISKGNLPGWGLAYSVSGHFVADSDTQRQPFVSWSFHRVQPTP